MQTIPGVDFESMLSELGKYGASFLLSIQRLTKLDTLSPTMRDTQLANVGCLAVFQVSGRGARELAWELGCERIADDDIVGRPVHHSYVRASVATGRLPAFSITLRKPEFGDPELAGRIGKDAAAYLTSAEDIAAQQVELQQRIDQVAAEIEESHKQARVPLQPLPKNKGRKPRSKRTKRSG